MAAPLNPLHLDDAITRYLAGEPMREILAATGVSNTTFHRERSRRGIPPRRHLVLPDAEIVAAYEAGESEYSLSRRLGVSRDALRKRLTEYGAQIRGRSQAGTNRTAGMTADERLAQAAAAHDAVRGTKQTMEQLLARSQAREARGLTDSDGEQFLHDALVRRGLVPVVQKSIGKYNVDLAVAPVAVEVLGGGWHLAKRHHAVRTPHILNAGWSLLFVWNHEGDSALREGAAEYVVSYLEEARRDPSLVGEYRVISGSGEFLSRGRADDGEFALVPPPRGRLRRRS